MEVNPFVWSNGIVYSMTVPEYATDSGFRNDVDKIRQYNFNINSSAFVPIKNVANTLVDFFSNEVENCYEIYTFHFWLYTGFSLNDEYRNKAGYNVSLASQALIASDESWEFIKNLYTFDSEKAIGCIASRGDLSVDELKLAFKRFKSL